jgi:radical SAM protein with 4Fe4S-binding SPASM domain
VGIIFNKTLSFLARYIKAQCRRRDRSFADVPVLNIETTNVCDARCVFCPNAIMKRKREHLDTQLFKKAVEEFVAMGGEAINLNAVIGEPLLDPYILSRIRHVKQFPQIKSVGFVTNLHWLHNMDMAEFLNSGIDWLSISAIFSGREKFLEFFGVDRYSQTLDNIVRLIQENKNHGNRIEIKFSIKPTREDIRETYRHEDFKMVDKLTGGALSRELVNQGLCVDDWTGRVKLPAYLRKRPLLPRFFAPCKLLYNSLIIFSNGNIGICPCRDFEADSELILGHIAESNLKEVWVGEKIKSIIRGWAKKNRIPQICRVCSHYIY